ncbi:MAG: hypothetical protein U0637_01610 [Phycisphaerales bacterium]
MTIERNNPDVNDEPLPRDDADLLISRAVDGRTSQAEWVLLELAAAQDPTMWRRLAQAHRDQALLVKGVGRALDVAEHVELPSRLEAERHASADHSFIRSARVWGGWAAAAMLTVAVVLQNNQGRSPAGPATAGVAGPLSSADAFNTYLSKGVQEGRVLGEVPDQVLVDSRPAENGQGFDVVYVRQVVEKARVPDLYRFSHDEAGRATPVRLRARAAQESAPTVY